LGLGLEIGLGLASSKIYVTIMHTIN